jgi:hypothetical protein
MAAVFIVTLVDIVAIVVNILSVMLYLELLRCASRPAGDSSRWTRSRLGPLGHVDREVIVFVRCCYEAREEDNYGGRIKFGAE